MAKEMEKTKHQKRKKRRLGMKASLARCCLRFLDADLFSSVFVSVSFSLSSLCSLVPLSRFLISPLHCYVFSLSVAAVSVPAFLPLDPLPLSLTSLFWAWFTPPPCLPRPLRLFLRCFPHWPTYLWLLSWSRCVSCCLTVSGFLLSWSSREISVSACLSQADAHLRLSVQGGT